MQNPEALAAFAQQSMVRWEGSENTFDSGLQGMQRQSSALPAGGWPDESCKAVCTGKTFRS